MYDGMSPRAQPGTYSLELRIILDDTSKKVEKAALIICVLGNLRKPSVSAKALFH